MQSLTSPQVALGLPSVSTDQEYNADFAGTGLSNLLLYNREQGGLDVLNLSNELPQSIQMPDWLLHKHFPSTIENEILADLRNTLVPQRVSLADATTPVNGWGSSLDIHIGNFTGTKQSDILLYDRVTGQLQLISLTPQLTIKQHVPLSGWGPGWELYVGRFDGQRSGLFMYNRFVASNTQPGPVSSPVLNPTASPTLQPSATVSPTVSPTLQPSATASPTESSTPQPSATVSPTASPTLEPGSTVSPTSQPSATASPTASPTVTSNPIPSSSATQQPDQTPSSTARLRQIPGSSIPLESESIQGSNDLSGSKGVASAVQDTPANALLLDLDQDLNVQQVQSYTLSSNTWEVYVGRFVNPQQDGIFLYDRTSGEARMMSFTSSLLLAYSQEIHNLIGNWEVGSGDFQGSGQAQVLLYDPMSGNGQILAFAPDLSLMEQKSYSGWGINRLLYVGHFGSQRLSVMLYDAQAGKSILFAFDASLEIIHYYTVQSWDQRWQILVGAFLDQSRCEAGGDCATGDDILALDRLTGQMQQFVFSLLDDKTTISSYYKHVRAFQDEVTASAVELRNGNPMSDITLNSLTTIDSPITNEELY